MKGKMTLNITSINNFITLGGLLLVYVIVLILKEGGITTNLINGQLVPICAYMIMAISLNLTVGILGELSLGHAGFMSVGAFGGVFVGTLMQEVSDSKTLCLLVAVIAGGLMAALAGLLIGIPVLRLRGDYLAIVTLAFGQIIKSIVNILYVGLDADGLHVGFIEKPEILDEGKMIISGAMGATGIRKMSTFTFAFIVLMVCLIVIYNLIQSRTGRAIMALRDNRIAAESVGINVTKYKLLVFSISAAMAGMAGTVFAYNYSTVAPTKFDFNTSILVLVFVVLGGLGSMRGSLIAAALLTLLPELLRQFSDYRMLVYAVVLILVMIATNNPFIREMFGTLKEEAVCLIKKLINKLFGEKTAKGEKSNG